MRYFFKYIRNNRKEILTSHGDAMVACSALLSQKIDWLPISAQNELSILGQDERDYAIASAYSLLLGKEKRKQLSAYFTPPGLASATIVACSPFLTCNENPTVLDPTCGGGSFLTPIVRFLIERKLKQGKSKRAACLRTLRDVDGIELDAGLAGLSEIFLRQMIEKEFDYSKINGEASVQVADALTASVAKKYDLVVGNPPYGKVGQRVDSTILAQAGDANLGGHTNFYSLFLLRGLDWVKPGGGLVFIIPTSFVAGPYFAGLRSEILRRASVQRIDLHEQRGNLFLGAIQDVYLLILQKRQADASVEDCADSNYETGLVDASGKRTKMGSERVRPNGMPWTLPVKGNHTRRPPSKARKTSEDGKPYILSDYGYRIRVGKVVPTRERERLKLKGRKGDIPLIWASVIRPDATFDFEAPNRLRNARWYRPEEGDYSEFLTAKPAVLVQRTSNRDQERRLYAASVPENFRKKYPAGFIAENHVIVIEADRSRPIVPLSLLTRLLNSEVVNERFSAVSGSFSVSAKLLQQLALPDPQLIRKIERKRFEDTLRALFDNMHDVLTFREDSQRTSNRQDTIDKSGNMVGGFPIDKKTRFKRSAVS